MHAPRPVISRTPVSRVQSSAIPISGVAPGQARPRLALHFSNRPCVRPHGASRSARPGITGRRAAAPASVRHAGRLLLERAAARPCTVRAPADARRYARGWPRALSGGDHIGDVRLLRRASVGRLRETGAAARLRDRVWVSLSLCSTDRCFSVLAHGGVLKLSCTYLVCLDRCNTTSLSLCVQLEVVGCNGTPLDRLWRTVHRLHVCKSPPCSRVHMAVPLYGPQQRQSEAIWY